MTPDPRRARTPGGPRGGAHGAGDRGPAGGADAPPRLQSRSVAGVRAAAPLASEVQWTPPLPPPDGEAAGLPPPPDGHDPVPALLVPGLLLLRALRFRLPAQTFVEHRQGTHADLPEGRPGTPSSVLKRPLFGYPLLRADQGEGRRGPGAIARERDDCESRGRRADPCMTPGPASPSVLGARRACGGDGEGAKGMQEGRGVAGEGRGCVSLRSLFVGLRACVCVCVCVCVCKTDREGYVEFL